MPATEPVAGPYADYTVWGSPDESETTIWGALVLVVIVVALFAMGFAIGQSSGYWTGYADGRVAGRVARETLLVPTGRGIYLHYCDAAGREVGYEYGRDARVCSVTYEPQS